MKMVLKNNKAFTLAEVLITLGIIGVVASMTIPTLAKNYQDYQYKVAYKKSYAVAMQALSEANRQDLIVSVTGEGDILNRSNFLAFMSQFKVTKKCISNNNSQCWNPVGDKLGGNPTAGTYAFVDASGAAWSMYWSSSGCIFVDTNGDNLPNRWGKDRFNFHAYVVKGNVDSYGGTPIKWSPANDGWQHSDYYGKSWLLN